MATRRDSREWATQLLFQLDLNPGPLATAFAEFWRGKRVDNASRAFTEELVRGARGNLERIDELLKKYLENWAIDRLGVVERNVLRMAVYELFYMSDIPPVVTINEAVDVAKYFCSAESGRFINGILDRMRKEMGHEPRQQMDAVRVGAGREGGGGYAPESARRSRGRKG